MITTLCGKIKLVRILAAYTRKQHRKFYADRIFFSVLVSHIPQVKIGPISLHTLRTYITYTKSTKKIEKAIKC